MPAEQGQGEQIAEERKEQENAWQKVQAQFKGYFSPKLPLIRLGVDEVYQQAQLGILGSLSILFGS